MYVDVPEVSINKEAETILQHLWRRGGINYMCILPSPRWLEYLKHYCCVFCFILVCFLKKNQSELIDFILFIWKHLIFEIFDTSGLLYSFIFLSGFLPASWFSLAVSCVLCLVFRLTLIVSLILINFSCFFSSSCFLSPWLPSVSFGRTSICHLFVLLYSLFQQLEFAIFLHGLLT